MHYFEKLPGERLYLSPMDPEDAALFAKWMNDVEVTRWLGQTSNVYSLSAEQDWLAAAAKNTQTYQFTVVLRDGHRPIGNIGLTDVNLVYRIATLGVFIGEAQERSKGYGAEAIHLLLDYGFQWLGLHNINLYVNSSNARAIACYQKVGFREYGRRRGAIFANGQRWDNVAMEVLAEEYLAARGEKITKKNSCILAKDMV